jgi:hypothetical protein
MTRRRACAYASPMLHQRPDLPHRWRTLLDKATVSIPAGHRSGWSATTARARAPCCPDRRRAVPDDGAINVPRSAPIGQVAQEAPGGPEPDRVRARRRRERERLAEAETAHDPATSPTSTSAWPTSPPTPRRRAPRYPGRPRSTRRPAAPPRGIQTAGACAWRWRPCCSPSPICCCSRADQLPRPRGHAVAGETTCATIPTPCSSSADRELLNRPSLDPTSGPGQPRSTLAAATSRGGAAKQRLDQAPRSRRRRRHIAFITASRPTSKASGRRAASRRWPTAADRRADRGAVAPPCSRTQPRPRQPADPPEGAAASYAPSEPVLRGLTCASMPTTASACSEPTATAKAPSPG